MSRLNLSRRPGQSIRIGERGEIEITVVRVRGQAVDLVIAADASVPVHREEIFLAREQAAASRPPSGPDGEPPRRPTIVRRRRRLPSD